MYPVEEDVNGLLTALDKVCEEATNAVREGYTLLVLSDKDAGIRLVPISSLLSLGAVHHHLIKMKLRMKVGIIVETGEARFVK